MPGRNYSTLFDLAAEQYGFVTAADARRLGVDPHRLAVMEQRGLLVRVDRGLFRFPAIPATELDEFMQATLWPRGQGTIAHESALDLHGLCDVNPAKIHITVPAGLRLRRAAPAVYVIHRQDLREDERALHEGIPVVTPLRAILDGIDAGLRQGLIEQAIETARDRGLVRRRDLARIASLGQRAVGA